MASQDAQQLAAAGDGDATAFRSLVDAHMRSVIATTRRILRDEAEAEDIVQETFLRLWHAASDLDVGDTGIRPWLNRVAVNLAIDRLRARKRLDVMDDLPEIEVGPEQVQSLADQDTAAQVHDALQSLPERQRLALTLFHFEEFSQKETADALEITEEALESLLARGRRGLKQRLQDQWRELLAAVR